MQEKLTIIDSLPFHPVITFSSVCVCFILSVSCLWSVLHVSQISVNNIPTLSLLQFVFKNSASILRKLYFLNQYKFLIPALSPPGMLTRPDYGENENENETKKKSRERERDQEPRERERERGH